MYRKLLKLKGKGLGGGIEVVYLTGKEYEMRKATIS